MVARFVLVEHAKREPVAAPPAIRRVAQRELNYLLSNASQNFRTASAIVACSAGNGGSTR